MAGINIVSAYMVIVATELKTAVTTQARRGICFVTDDDDDILAEEEEEELE
jgi:predicted dinucleotide-binding enzyme